MKDECGVRDKAERAKHIIYFCRGCQVIKHETAGAGV